MSRKEGRRIRGGIPMDAVSPFIMPNRTGASNIFQATVDIGRCEELLRQKKAEGLKGIGMMHIFMAAYVRMLSQYPGVNRFIRGQRVYARKNIEICLTIKKELKLNAPETVIKLCPSPSDTLDVIYSQLQEEIIKNKEEGDQNSMDSFARLLIYMPRVLLKFVVWMLKFFDYFGMLPRALTKLSPFHGSMFITNLGSLGIPPVCHHLYNFGNLPVFVAMGTKRTEYVLNKDGEVEKRRLIDFTFMCDERICDGHYYATAFKKLKRLLEKPEELLTAPETVVEDIR
ncbi:MAG: 2-oxo acid dehydrogenase subunit E2 [Clostridia bacterium]|nr:2-oxo acid dehydrogenase subunit E2 [Clostridia bacterium]